VLYTRLEDQFKQISSYFNGIEIFENGSKVSNY
jgi:hypothetical protein